MAFKNDETPNSTDSNTEDISTLKTAETSVSGPAKLYSSCSLTEKSLYEIENEWKRWSKGNDFLYIPPVVGTVSSLILQKIAGMIGDKLLKSVFEKLFPTPNPVTMLEILEAVQKLLDERLSQEVHQRITLELEGLQQNITNFLEDVEDFEGLIIIDKLEDGNQPLAIIDSINTLNQLFDNRMPQFRNPSYKVLLLPLYAQAANLHISFLKDVVDNASKWGLTASQIKTYTNRFLDKISEYSNYCIETYQHDFQSKFSQKLQDVLKYRNFMTINVLDYTSLWPMLRFTKPFNIRTSSNLYEMGPTPGEDFIFPYSSWANFNRIFQGFPNKELQSISATNRFYRAYKQSGGWSMLAITEVMGNLTCNYSGGKSIKFGYESLPSCPDDTGVQRCDAVKEEINDFSRSQLNQVLLSSSISTTNPPYMSAKYLQNVKLSNGTVYNLINGEYGSWISYPNYTIRNIIGWAKFMESKATNIIEGPSNQYEGSLRGNLSTSIVSFQRREYDPYTIYNGVKRHTIPSHTRGVLISPLEYSDTFNVGTGTKGKFVIHERHGNNGDAVIIPKTNGGYRHGFEYILFNPYGTNLNIDIYVKVSVPVQTKLVYLINGAGLTKEIVTSTDNDGVTDNGQKSKIIKLYSNKQLVPGNTTFSIRNGGLGDIYLEGIVVVPNGSSLISRI
ncbi:insecticidal delta-endotoxin Cry8Ea1 family protein [Bacillus thuringiensis]|uniref:insecticidal delta-endotoxin Cry8Ea1 family protein n=1 Tax=Bacillus thuringiensis TaxID=1428 RepID=UPI0001CAC594|nr:insecticidal delta-endotoxin Cry8Ea1 family protein [Bacillus thuringiensis]MDY8164687.1 insecticidal delta-endotoxin Cry8Ea1 family protein [Bacillus thuringiensis]MED3069066.1 insecticidal delta-endotoxin Cry8Ea1 family protein [Bacillus thuringiensis]